VSASTYTSNSRGGDRQIHRRKRRKAANPYEICGLATGCDAGTLTCGAAAIDDLIALRLERRDPFVHGREARQDIRLIAKAQLYPGSLEHSSELFVGQLHEQVGEELASFFADGRIDERSGT
jgi:hypothetical protein